MKVLIVGEDRFPIYEKAFKKAFIGLGLECDIFGWYPYTSGNSLVDKVQNKFLFGPNVNQLNNELYKKVLEYQPDLLFLYRPTMIFLKTLDRIKKELNLKIFIYHNDDPFSKLHPRYLNRHYMRLLPLCDRIFSYRQKNLKDYKKLGYENISLLRSYYLKEKNYYIPNSEKLYDVIFIGHFEDDGRDEYILNLLKNDIKVKVFGPNWKSSKYYNNIVEKSGTIKAVYGDEYNLVLNQAKIALVFLSKLNHDTYTRRCFEIPATQTLMLSEYSDDIVSMFEKEKEADYFRNKEEMLEKINYYLQHDNLRHKIGMNGYNRLLQDGHEVTERVREILSVYEQVSTYE